MANLDQHEVWSNRAAQIQQFCTERGITKLFHFTRIENLRSILREGLLSRETLDTRGQQYCFNDEYRLEGHKNAVCLSISFPNYKLFYKYRVESGNHIQWIVLHIDAKVLWRLDCAFFHTNAAASAMTSISLDEHKEFNALEAMFLNAPEKRRALDNNEPTDPQAEILVFSPIPQNHTELVACSF